MVISFVNVGGHEPRVTDYPAALVSWSGLAAEAAGFVEDCFAEVAVDRLAVGVLHAPRGFEFLRLPTQNLGGRRRVERVGAGGVRCVIEARARRRDAAKLRSIGLISHAGLDRKLGLGPLRATRARINLRSRIVIAVRHHGVDRLRYNAATFDCHVRNPYENSWNFLASIRVEHLMDNWEFDEGA